MPRKKSSVIWLLPVEDLQQLVDESCSIVEVLQKMGYDGYNGNHRTLTRRLKHDKIDTSIMKDNWKKHRVCFEKENSVDILYTDYFIENSNKTTRMIKKYVLQYNMIEYKCLICGNNGMHLNRPLVLQLDHINGKNSDHRIENLRFLCPNCHSQTDTFSGKNADRPEKKIYQRENEIQKKARIEKMRRFEMERDSLIELIKKHSLLEIGRMLGVSGNAIKKRALRLKINVKEVKKAVDGT